MKRTFDGTVMTCAETCTDATKLVLNCPKALEFCLRSSAIRVGSGSLPEPFLSWRYDNQIATDDPNHPNRHEVIE